jgi:hypothetical protein
MATDLASTLRSTTPPCLDRLVGPRDCSWAVTMPLTAVDAPPRVVTVNG